MRFCNLKQLNILLIIGLVACSSPTYMDAEDDIAEAVDTTTDLLSPAHVVVTDEAFIDTRPVFHAYHPIWTDREVSIDLNDKTTTLKELMGELFKSGGNINVMYDAGVDDPTISGIMIDGKLIDVIKQISKAANVHYIIEDNDLIWTPFETRIFQLGILPGNSTYKMGGESSGVFSGAQGVVGGAQSGGNVSYSAATDTPWTTIESILNELKSDEGTLVSHQDASTITVIDRPNNMGKIANYIERFNKYHMQQVGIKVQVLEVQLDEKHKRGIDWTIKRTTAYSETELNMNLDSPPNSTLENTVGGLFNWKILAGSNSIWADSAINLLQFIEQQGNVAIISEPRFTILNNQTAEIKITSDKGYVSKTSGILTAGGSQTTAENGMIRTGFSLYVLPTIFDDEVLLQISTSISRNLGVTSFDAGNNTTVQLPNLTDRKFTQRSLVPNNATLVLTGFKELETNTGDQTPFKINLLGGQSSERKTTEIVVLITPVIIRG